MMEPISEEVIKGTAKICGPHSSAAKALEEARHRRERGEEVAFFKTRGPIIVASRAAATAPEGKGAGDA